jgi:hypothetical protein
VRVPRRGVVAWCFAIALTAAGAAGAQAPAPGSSIATAIQLPGIQHETQGVDAEYAYIKKTYPGWTLKAQALLADKGKQYDSIEIAGPGGATKTVFFDITPWFGK